MKRFLAIAMAAAFAGCITTKETHLLDGPRGSGETRVVDTVVVSNTGWYFFFDLLPIVCSDPDDGGIKMFSDDLSVQDNLKVLDRIIRREGATGLENITSHETNESVLVFLFNRHVIYTSATLLKERPKEDPAAK